MKQQTPTPLSPFVARWLAESVRLKIAASHGPREAGEVWAEGDTDYDPAGLPEAGRAERRILFRAREMAGELGLWASLRRWQDQTRLTLLITCVLMLVLGISSAFAVLGDTTINVVWALGGLIGVHMLMLLIWLVSLALSRDNAGGLLGRFWFWVSGRLASQYQQPVMNSFIDLSIRHRLTPWYLGSLTHLFWTMLLTGALLGLLLALSVRSYIFIWETTILSPEVFVDLVRTLAWLPARFGFNVPSEEIIRGSSIIFSEIPTRDPMVAMESAEYRQAWSSWLVGCLMLYGILPRLALTLFCFTKLRLGRKKVSLDLGSSAWSVIAARLAPTSARVGVNDPDTSPTASPKFSVNQQANANPVLLGLEIPGGTPWARSLPTQVRVISPVDNREQRRDARHVLQHTPPRRLLIACDATLSPDRGSLGWMAAISAHAGETRVYLVNAERAPQRLQVWRDSLLGLGLKKRQLLEDEGKALQWVTEAPE